MTTLKNVTSSFIDHDFAQPYTFIANGPSIVESWSDECECQYSKGPFYWYGLTLTLNLDKLLHPSSSVWYDYLSTPKRQRCKPFKFGKGYVISSHTFMDVWLLIHTGRKRDLIQVPMPWTNNYILSGIFETTPIEYGSIYFLFFKE